METKFFDLLFIIRELVPALGRAPLFDGTKQDETEKLWKVPWLKPSAGDLLPRPDAIKSKTLLALIEFFHMETFRACKLWDLWWEPAACESSCGHTFCNHSRWELMVPKRDQLQILSSFRSLSLYLPVPRSLFVSPAL